MRIFGCALARRFGLPIEQFSRSNSMMHHFRACEALESNDGVGARIAIEADIAGAASDIEKVLT